MPTSFDDATGEVYDTATPLADVAAEVMFDGAGRVRTGLLTVTVNVDAFVWVSAVTVQVTVVIPTANASPDPWSHVGVPADDDGTANLTSEPSGEVAVVVMLLAELIVNG